MMEVKTGGVSRRIFLRQTAAGAALTLAASRRGWAETGWLPISVGYSVISWPPDAFEQAFQTISALGYRGVQLLAWVQDAYPAGKALQLKTQLRNLKLFPAALSCRGVSLRPDAPDEFMSPMRQ